MASPPNGASARQMRWAALLLLFLPLLLVSPGLMPDRVIVTTDSNNTLPWNASATREELSSPRWTTDAVRENLSYRVFLNKSLRDGELPLWTPYIYMGMPFAALSHVEVFYPPSWVAALVNPYLATGALIAFHLIVAGLAMLFMLRTLGLSPLASFVGGLVFMLNGLFVTRMGHPQYAATGCWLPLVCVGINWITASGVDRSLVPRGIAMVCFGTTMAVLAGHPSIYVYGFYFVGAWLLVRLFYYEPFSWSQRGFAIGAFALGFALALGLGSAQLLATIEFAGFSDRNELPFRNLRKLMPHWMHLFRAIFWTASGSPVRGTYWSLSSTQYPAGTLYIGILPTLLAFIGALRSGRRGYALAGVVLLAVLIMFVPPVYWVAHQILPGFDFSRVDRLSIVFFQAAAVLSAFGAEHVYTVWLKGEDDAAFPYKAIGRWFAPGLVFALATGIAISWAQSEHPARHAKMFGQVELLMSLGLGVALWLISSIWLGLAERRPSTRYLLPAMIVLLVGDLGWFLFHNTPVRVASRVVRNTPAIDFLQADTEPYRITRYGGRRTHADEWVVFPSNNTLMYEIEDLNGFGPMHDRNLDHVLGPTEAARMKHKRPWRVRPVLDVEALASPVYDLLQVKYVLAERQVDLPGYRRVHEGDVFIYENEDVMPRAWFVDHHTVIDDPTEAAVRLHRGAINPRRSVILHEPTPPASGSAEPGANPVTFVGRTLNSVELEKNGPDAGWVVLSESYYPGWKATVNQQSTPVRRANVHLRAVWVGAGKQRIRFYYEPTWLFAAEVLTGGGALGLIGLLVVAWRRRSPASTADTAPESTPA